MASFEMNKFKQKIYLRRWYRNPRTNKFEILTSKEQLIEIIDFLQLKSIIRITKNKKSYITVMLTSNEEAKKLKKDLIRY